MKIRNKYCSIWLIFILFGFGLLCSCTRQSADEEKKRKKNTLTLNFVLGDVPSLDPHDLASGSRGLALGKWLFEGLTRLNLQGEYELAGAASVEISPCKKCYLFTLRPNFYSDGTLVVAQDYEYAWKKALSAESNCPKAHLFYCIKNAEKAKKKELSLKEVGIRAIDEKTLYVELTHPTSYFLSLLSNPLFAPSKKRADQDIFNGPYMIDKWKKNDTLHLKRNPFFWDQDHITIDKIDIFSVRDSVTAFSLYEKGEIDWIGDPFSYLPSDILSSELSKGNLHRGSGLIYPFWIYLNTEYFPLSSPLIRRALSSVIDRQRIADYIFIGDDPLFAPVPGEFSLEEQQTLAEGKRLFEEGMRELKLTKETFPTLILSSCSLTKHKKLAEYLQERWKTAFGISVELDVQDWGTFYHNIKVGKYQVGGAFVSSDYNDPLACLETLASKDNFSRWQNSSYQEGIDKIRREEDGSVKDHFLKEVKEILYEEMPIIWVVNQSQHHSYRSDLKGVCFDQRGTPDMRWAYFE